MLFTTGASSGLRLAADALAAGNGGGGAKVGRAGARVLVPVPTYPLAAQCFVEAGLRVEEVASTTGPGTLPAPAEVASRVRGDVAAVYWNAYNNPTGTPLDREGLLALARAWVVGPEPLVAAMERRNATVAPSSVSPLAPVLWQDRLCTSSGRAVASFENER